MPDTTIMLSLESMDSRMMRLGRQEVYYKRNQSLDETLEQIDAVTVDDISEIAQNLFQAEQLTVVELLPANGEDQ